MVRIFRKGSVNLPPVPRCDSVHEGPTQAGIARHRQLPERRPHPPVRRPRRKVRRAHAGGAGLRHRGPEPPGLAGRRERGPGQAGASFGAEGVGGVVRPAENDAAIVVAFADRAVALPTIWLPFHKTVLLPTD